MEVSEGEEGIDLGNGNDKGEDTAHPTHGTPSILNGRKLVAKIIVVVYGVAEAEVPVVGEGVPELADDLDAVHPPPP